MFNELRDSDRERQSFQEAMGLGTTSEPGAETRTKRSARGLLGMSAGQRLLIALLLLMSVVVIGTMCLLVTGRISAF